MMTPSPCAPYPSMNSDQPTMPSSVVIFRNELTRQPASQCNVSSLVIFIALSRISKRSARSFRRYFVFVKAEAVAERIHDRQDACTPRRVLDPRLIVFVGLRRDHAVKSIDAGHLHVHSRARTGVAVMLA